MAAQGLKDYLQRYVDKPEADGGKAKSKKKKKRKGQGAGGNAGQGVIIVDDDAVWHREQKAEEEDEPDEEGEGPTVIEDVEVKRMHRMEALKTHRPYLSMANDGSGWVTVKHDEDGPEAMGATRARDDADNSPPRSPEGKSPFLSAKRKRYDSPDLSPPRRREGSPDVALGRRERAEDSSPSRRPNKSVTVTRGRLSSPDLSPPRRIEGFPEVTRGRRPKSFTEGRFSPPDLSPPRRREGFPDVAPGRRPKSFKGEDSSPPRRRRDSPDLSPPRRRHGSPPDESPILPSKRKRMDSPDLSLPRRNKSSPDGPPGRRISKFSSLGTEPESPPQKRKGPPDLSPPRRGHASSDLSPPRRRKGSVDISPPRRSRFSSGDPARMRRDSPDRHPPRGRHDSPDNRSPGRSRRPASASQDLLPPRRRRNSPDRPPGRRVLSKDLSPPRNPTNAMPSPKRNRSEDSSPPRQKKGGSGRMADGAFAGLKSDREVVSEAERRRAAEAKMLSELDPSLSGRGAETVFRDKRGRRLEGLEEMLRQQRGEAKPAEQPLEWGKGLAQKKVVETNLAELEAEKSKPFARYRDDAELDKSLKERLRWGDPMAHLVKQKASEPVLEDLGEREEMKASGFIVPQDIPNHSWLKRGTAPPPNRYDIRPGRHWDGVDRSTGFEQGLFKQKNEKKARELEAYLWSVSDM